MTDVGARRGGLRTMADLATPMAIRVAATLRVADHLAAGHRTAGQIAEVAGAHAGALDRVLRHLVTVGLFTVDDHGAYTATELGGQLRDDHPSGRRRWLDIGGAVGRGDLCFVDLEHTVRTGEAAYPVRYGTSFWADLEADPALAASFAALMNQHLTRDNKGITDAYDWAALGHLVDVGGGNGAQLEQLLLAHPGLTGTLVDLPSAAGDARRRFADAGLSERTTVVAGSFFDPLPPGAGGYLLSAIIHDWNDDAAVAILRRCAQAAGSKGVVLVVEAVGADGEAVSTGMDLRMLAYHTGRERPLGELAELAGRAGLAVCGVHPIGPSSITSVIELGALAGPGPSNLEERPAAHRPIP